MPPQLTHENAARTLRNAIQDCGGYKEYHAALDFILDELKATTKDNMLLRIERDNARKEITTLVGNALRDQDRRNQAALRAVAERNK